jgi:hypothetical protein
MSFFSEPTFVRNASLADAASAAAMAVLDINGDGRLDVIYAGNAGQGYQKSQIEILMGTKNGGFKSGGSLFEGTLPERIAPHRVVLEDFNGDGKLDVFFGCYGADDELQLGEQQLLLLSTGKKLMVAPSGSIPTDTSTAHGLSSGDIDGDGDIDIYVAVNGGNGEERRPYFLINDGTGHFTKASDLVPPQFGSEAPGVWPSAELADFNNDGYADLWLGANHNYEPSPVLANDGTGHFVDKGGPRTHVDQDIYAVFVDSFDIDGDGLVDVVQAEGDGSDGGTRNLTIYSNKGDFQFVDETSTRVFGFGRTKNVDWHGINDVQFFDYNGDGAKDILIEYNYDDFRILLNNGDGVFFLPKDGLVPNRGGQVVGGDFNQDGHPDLMGFIGGGPVEIYQWTWTHKPTYPLVGSSKKDVLFGDAKGNAMDGKAGNDAIRSGAGKDKVNGGDGNDMLDGGSGKDSLYGGLGKDKLIGGVAADKFVFSVKAGAANADKIFDFGDGSDRIVLDHESFKGLKTGALSDAKFYAAPGATAAHDKSDRVVYDETTGRLYFDDDGPGGHVALLVATLASHASLSADDFIIV